MLVAVSAAKGTVLAQYDLDSSPVFDGMAASRGSLFMATTKGEILCYRDQGAQPAN
jgi:hypothetical protein